MDLQKIQQKLNENNYDFILKKDHYNELEFVHINLVEKLSRFFSDNTLKIQWNDNPSVADLLKINNDVFCDISIDTRKVNETNDFGFIVAGFYIPTDLPVNIFNRITNKLFNIASVEKKKHGNNEYIYFWWD